MPRLVRASSPFPGPGGLVALLLLVSACGGETPGAPPPPPPVPPPPPPPIDGGRYEGVACPALQPARTTGQPLDRVVVGQVPGTFQAPYFAYVEEANGTAQGFSLMEVNDAGALELLVPVHPSGSPAGGPARIWISDGTRACASFDFTVQALAPAPGEFAAIVGLAQELVAAQAAEMGTTVQELVTTPPSQMPPELVGLAVAQALLDHPGNDRSLVAVAAGTSPISAAVRFDLLEPLLARTGLRAALEALVSPSAGLAPSSGPARQRAEGYCSPAYVGTSAERLAECMSFLSERSEFENLPPASEKLKSIVALVELKDGTDPDGSVAYFLWTSTLVPRAQQMASLPSTLTGMTVQADPLVFAEDQPGPGKWTARLMAGSTGFDKEAVAYMDAGLAEVLTKMGRGELIVALGLVGANEVVAALLGPGGLESLATKPETFGPVDVSDAKWSEADIVSGTAVVVGTHPEYEPRAAGTATLRVQPKNFASTNSVEARQAIEVREIEMMISPTEVALTAGEEVEFTVTVIGTHTQNVVEPLISGGAPTGTVVSWERVSVTPGDVGHTEVYRLRYRAPSEPGVDQSLKVGMTHSGFTGARAAPGSPARQVVAEVLVGKVEISPPSGFCLEPGVPQPFTAKVTGLTSQAVNWTASLGNITSGGVYTAQPSTPPGTEVTITATSQVNDKVKDQVTIRVGGCGCAFQIELDGNIYTAQSGDSVSYADFGGLTGFSMRTWQDPLAPSLRRTAAVGVPVDPRISGPGAWNFGPDQAESGDLLGTLAAPADHVWWNGGEHNFFSFVLDRYERGVEMAGSLSGFTNLESLLDSSIRIVPISMSFSMSNTEPDFLGIIHTCVVK